MKEGSGGGVGPNTLRKSSGICANLTTGPVMNSVEATGARAKNILIFLASSGIRENAIKPVRTKGKEQNSIFQDFPLQRQGWVCTLPSSGNLRTMQIRVKVVQVVVPNSLQPHGLYSTWNSPGENTGVDSRSLL